MTTRDERYYYASQFTLMWWKFKKHRLALAAVLVLTLFYLIALCAEFIAPYTPTTDSDYLFVPPAKVHFSAAGEGLQRPFIYDMQRTRDLDTLRWVYHEDQQQKHVVRLLVRGVDYKLWNLFRTNLHLFGTEET